MSKDLLMFNVKLRLSLNQLYKSILRFSTISTFLVWKKGQQEKKEQAAKKKAAKKEETGGSSSSVKNLSKSQEVIEID